MPSSALRILIAEDDPDISNLYKKALEKRNHNVVLTASGDTCIQNYLDNLPPTATIHKPSSRVAMTSKMDSSYHREMNYESSHTKKTGPMFFVESSYDIVILDYKMPGMNGMDVAKEILAVNPRQRIIFASAYVEETLRESVKQLKLVIELMQKPFSLSRLIDTVEDKEVYEELKILNLNVARIRDAELSHQTLMDLLERLRKIQKNRAF
ncbi:MAG: response regulator [Nitrososphaeraceae archaeon]